MIAITSYAKQRLDLVRGLIDKLPPTLKPALRSPYA